MKLIVQIPAFNEEATIAQALRDLPKKIDGITSIETLVIDDGSSDRTAEVARKAGATHILQLRSHRGLSASARTSSSTPTPTINTTRRTWRASSCRSSKAPRKW